MIVIALVLHCGNMGQAGRSGRIFINAAHHPKRQAGCFISRQSGFTMPSQTGEIMTAPSGKSAQRGSVREASERTCHEKASIPDRSFVLSIPADHSLCAMRRGAVGSV